MKTPRIFTLFIACMMLIILSGCMTSWIGVPNVSVSDRTEGFKTKKDVYDTWGAPDNVVFVGEDEYVTYVPDNPRAADSVLVTP